jgi:hypothetical protein
MSSAKTRIDTEAPSTEAPFDEAQLTRMADLVGLPADAMKREGGEALAKLLGEMMTRMKEAAGE